jgi:formylglycine-generating enzyme required for sulfatase activity
MEFVWIEALKIWVGKYEVTNGEYRKMARDHDSESYEGRSLNGDRQPVVSVNFDDGKNFAEWMTAQDRGVLGGARYRHPTEQEFMVYAQCGRNWEYPWGNESPPRSGQAGNYADETAKRVFKSVWTPIELGYDDGHAVPCDVEKSLANPWNLFGVGGNVWEACTSDNTGGSFGAWRGASWYDYSPDRLRCASRLDFGGATRDDDGGFRLVLVR